jgi:DNA-binding NarL/FixJ family response regulator
MDKISTPLQIYVVEDSAILRRLIESSIEASGAQLVGYSGSAQRAVADLSMLQPDLIVIDISLESGTGFDVLRALQERTLLPKSIKVVLTNHGNNEYRNRSFRLGASHFFDKSKTSQVLALISTLAKSRVPNGAPARSGPARLNERRGEVVDTSRR